MGYKMIASDLDGTLNNDDGQISEENIKAIKKARENGIHFVICSGRSFESLKKFNAYAGLNEKGCYGIAFNGSVVYEADTLKILYEDRFQRSLALSTIEKIKKIDAHMPIMVYLEGDLVLYEKHQDYIDVYTGRTGVHKKQVDSFNRFLEKDVLKIIIRDEYNALQHLYEQLKHELDENCSMFFSDKNLLEFSSKSSNKAAGIRFLAGYLGISMNEVAAVGDQYNDLEMIQEAGLGIAVNNAVDALKEISDYITVNNNNNSVLREVVDLILFKQR